MPPPLPNPVHNNNGPSVAFLGGIANAIQAGFSGYNSGIFSGLASVLKTVMGSAKLGPSLQPSANGGAGPTAQDIFKSVAGVMTNAFNTGARAMESEFHRVFSSMRSAIYMIELNVASFVRLANPSVYIQFQRAVEDLYGVIGRALTPVLQSATAIIQKFADYINVFSENGDFAIVAVAGLAIAAGVGAGALVGLGAAIGVVSFAVDVLTGGTAAVFQALGALIGAMGGAAAAGGSLAVAFGFLTAPVEHIKHLMDLLMPSFVGMANMLGGALKSAMEFLVPVIELLARTFAMLAPYFRPIVDIMGKIFGGMFATILMTITSGVAAVVLAVSPFVIAMSAIARSISNMLPNVSSLAKAFGTMIGWITGILEAILGRAEENPLDRAPPAVRNAQAGTIAGDITRQQVLALQGGGVKDNPMQKATEELRAAIDEAREEIATLKEAIIKVAGEVKDTFMNALSVAANPLEAIRRLAVNQIVGK